MIDFLGRQKRSVFMDQRKAVRFDLSQSHVLYAGFLWKQMSDRTASPVQSLDKNFTKPGQMMSRLYESVCAH